MVPTVAVVVLLLAGVLAGEPVTVAVEGAAAVAAAGAVTVPVVVAATATVTVAVEAHGHSHSRPAIDLRAKSCAMPPSDRGAPPGPR